MLEIMEGMEAGCKRVDVEVFASRAPWLWRRDAGVWTSRRHRGMELLRCAAGRVDVEMFVSRALEL